LEHESAKLLGSQRIFGEGEECRSKPGLTSGCGVGGEITVFVVTLSSYLVVTLSSSGGVGGEITVFVVTLSSSGGGGGVRGP